MRAVLLIIGEIALLFFVFVVIPLVGIAWCHGRSSGRGKENKV